jgi:antitoxin MazE
MQSKIISIGNSKGVRIPKAMLEECHIQADQEVSLTVVDDSIVISPLRKPRQGWEEAFQMGGQAEREDLWEGAPLVEGDEAEWQW